MKRSNGGGARGSRAGTISWEGEIGESGGLRRFCNCNAITEYVHDGGCNCPRGPCCEERPNKCLHGKDEGQTLQGEVPTLLSCSWRRAVAVPCSECKQKQHFPIPCRSLKSTTKRGSESSRQDEQRWGRVLTSIEVALSISCLSDWRVPGEPSLYRVCRSCSYSMSRSCIIHWSIGRRIDCSGTRSCRSRPTADLAPTERR